MLRRLTKCITAVFLFYSSMELYFCSLLLVLALASPSASQQSVVRRYSYGVVFSHVGQVYPKTSYWPHTFHFSLPTLAAWKPIEHWCDKSLSSDICVEYALMIQLAVTFANQTHDQFQRTLQAAYDLLPDSPLPPNFTKGKRSLLPFIGQLAGTLFGTATEEDVRVLASHVQAISKSQSDLLSGFQTHMQRMSSFMSLTKSQFDNLELLLQQQHNEFTESLLGQQQWFEQHNRRFELLMFHVLSKLYDYLMLHDQVQQLYNSLELLTSGFLPASLISASTIQNTLSEISETVKAQFPSLYLAKWDPAYYYSSHDFLFLRSGTELYITVKFPLFTYVEYLDVYSVLTFPVPFHNDSSLLTTLQTSVQYFLLSVEEFYFAEVDHPIPAFDKFAVDSVKQGRHSTCITALFHNDVTDIQKLCKFQVSSDDPRDQGFLVLDYPHVLVRHASSYHLGCDNESLSLDGGCTYCIVTIPCGCELNTKVDHLPPRLSNCNLPAHGLVSSAPLYPVNLAVLRHFFDNDTLRDFTADMLLRQPLGVKLPPMKFYNHTFEDKLAISHDLTYQLDKVVNASKAGEQTLRFIVDSL